MDNIVNINIGIPKTATVYIDRTLNNQEKRCHRNWTGVPRGDEFWFEGELDWYMPFFKFAFIRNPFDMLVSHYYWEKKMVIEGIPLLIFGNINEHGLGPMYFPFLVLQLNLDSDCKLSDLREYVKAFASEDVVFLAQNQLLDPSMTLSQNKIRPNHVIAIVQIDRFLPDHILKQIKFVLSGKCVACRF